MSWEADSDSARPSKLHTATLTPQRTPTEPAFDEDLFRTPRLDREVLGGTGWTPIFEEDYRAFGATPARFPDSQRATDTLSLGVSGFVGHKRLHSSTETLRAERENRAGQTQRSLSTEADSGLPSPSSARTTLLGRGSEDAAWRTPKKAGKAVEAAFTTQTATPPKSSHKHSTKASEVARKSKMQNEQDFFSQPGTMDGGYDLSFATPTNVDLFSFPMSGPSTAPAYMNGKAFWDPGNDMANMSMDFTGDLLAASEDWCQNADIFHGQQIDTTSHQVPQNTANATRRPRPLLAKPPASSLPPVQSGITFDFGITSLSEDPFTMPATSGAVNPNHLFSFPNMTPPLQSNAFNAASVQANSQIEIQPLPVLQSPLDLSRSRSLQVKRPESSQRARPISPLKTNRPGIHRSNSTSDNLKRPPALKPPVNISGGAQPPSNFAGKGRYSSGTNNANPITSRLSPTKQGSHTNLQAIPERGNGEKLFNRRTAVTFSIDANGRARTETTVIMEHGNEVPSSRDGSRPKSQARSASPMSGSSTDEEAIVIPSSRQSRVGLGLGFGEKQGRAMPKMARFETAVKQYPRTGGGGRKLSAGNVRALSKASLALAAAERDSDDDASVADTARRSSGDAAKALRRVMESRRRSVSGITSMPPSSGTQTIRIQSAGGRERERERQYRRQSYASSSTTFEAASTPSTVTDFDADGDGDVEMCGTPGTVGSEGTTRCVCRRREKVDDEFMIQCESCEHWQHSTCVKIDPRELPKVYICAFCAQTPNMRGGSRGRERMMVVVDSPPRRTTFR